MKKSQKNMLKFSVQIVSFFGHAPQNEGWKNIEFH